MPVSPSCLAIVLALATAVPSVLGCAAERKPINKVQANALSKAFFVGDPGNPDDDPVFYFRNFVVDASESQELIGIGSWSGVDRIRWDITEHMLFARRAYGQNPGADAAQSSSAATGTIIAAYPVTSHFDIKRAYNPQTGEDLNIVEENTTDRPWYERDFFRVDWSVNEVDSPAWSDMFIGTLTGDLKLTPIAYYVSDATRDDAPHFEPDDGYFDVTSKFLVEPVGSRYPGIPQCAVLGLYTGTAIQNCDPQEAVVRSSYWRVDRLDPDGDFEPFENTRSPLDIVGNPGGLGDSLSAGTITPPRITWDPGYGYVDPGMVRYLNIHDVWEQSHQTIGSCTVDDDCKRVTGRAESNCLPSKTCTVPCSYSSRADVSGPNGKGPNGTDDGCENASTGYEGSEGAQCSVRNRCTIPYRDRKIRPIAYWVNQDMPDDLQDPVDSSGKRLALGPTEDVVHTWNQAVALAVAHAREIECRRTGGERSDCYARYFETGQTEMVSYGGWGIERVKNRQDVVVTCHNPVRDYDPEICGPRGTVARVGDLRRHFIFYWPFASRAPWGGIGNWNADPLTGRIVGAAATVMGRSTTLAAAQIRDILMVSLGELDLSDVTSGVSATLWQDRLRNGRAATTLTPDEIAARVAGVDIEHSAAEQGILRVGATPITQMAALLQERARTSADPAFLSKAIAEVDGVLAPLLGSEYEANLIDPTWLVDAAGMDPTTIVDDSVRSQVSPLRGRDPWKQALAHRALSQDLSNHGICDLASADVGNPDVRGVAHFFGDPVTGRYSDAEILRRFPTLDTSNPANVWDARGKLIYDDLAKETYKGILLHEIGHSLGLLHNFAASYDSKNYQPQYWQLRTNEGSATASCNGTPRTGTNDSCMGPRFLDPETDDELGQAAESRPGINYFANASTMEYPNGRFFETAGLGQYDVMAMGALYGRVLETFDPQAADKAAGNHQRFVPLSFTQLTEQNLVDWTTPFLGSGVQPMHYTELARQLRLYDARRCRAATPDEATRAAWRIVHGKVCAGPPKDHAAWSDFADGTLFSNGDVPKAFVSTSAPGSAGNVRWPYRFGETTNAYIHTNPSDAGADPYEVTREAIAKFDYEYPFTYFRRQRRDFDYEALPSVVADRFFERLRAYHWVLARETGAIPSLGLSDENAFTTSDDVVRSELLAETDMLDALARTIVLPEIGDYGAAKPAYQLGASSPLYDVSTSVLRPVFSLDASTARFVDPDYDTSPQGGGSWDYLTWVKRAGFYVEKSNAATALADGRPTLLVIDRDTYIDGRSLYVSFRTDLARGVDRLLGGMLAGDWDVIAPSLPIGANEPEYLHLADLSPTRSAGKRLLFPNFGYIQQLGALVWTQVFARLSTDLTLANQIRITLEGTMSVIDIPDAEKIEFTDPRSGYTYVARRYGSDTIDGKVVDRGIGAHMLARANELLAKCYQVQTDGAGAPILDAYGRPSLILGAAGAPTVTGDANVQAALQDHVGLVDTAVQISVLLGHGPL